VVTRLSVRNDAEMRGMAASLANQRTSVKTAKYVNDRKAPRTTGTFLDRGILLASRGEYKLAVEDFTEALRLNPNMATAYALRARAMIAEVWVNNVQQIDANFGAISIGGLNKLTVEQSKVCDSAIADLNQAIRLDPENGSHYRERGFVYGIKYNKDMAMTDCNQAIRLNPNDTKAYIFRGRMYIDKGDYDKSMVDFNQAIRLDTNYALAYSFRGGAYLMKNDYDKAIADYNQAIRLNPNYTKAKQLLEEARKLRGR